MQRSPAHQFLTCRLLPATSVASEVAFKFIFYLFPDRKPSQSLLQQNENHCHSLKAISHPLFSLLNISYRQTFQSWHQCFGREQDLISKLISCCVLQITSKISDRAEENTALFLPPTVCQLHLCLL